MVELPVEGLVTRIVRCPAHRRELLFFYRGGLSQNSQRSEPEANAREANAREIPTRSGIGLVFADANHSKVSACRSEIPTYVRHYKVTTHAGS